MKDWFNKDRNKEFLTASWEVKKLCVAGRWRESVLLHHAQKSSLEAGQAMDSYLEHMSGRRCVNVRLVRKALSAMKKLDRVGRLMYRAGLIEQKEMVRLMDLNAENRRELSERVDMELIESLEF